MPFWKKKAAKPSEISSAKMSSPSTDPNNRDQTTRRIALWLLYAFLVSVAILFLTNIFIRAIVKDDPEGTIRNGWFDLLKNALILLGTALTTVIGYYFGQKEGKIIAERAQEKAEETDLQAQKVVSNAINAIKERDEAIIGNAGKGSDINKPDDINDEDSGSDFTVPK